MRGISQQDFGRLFRSYLINAVLFAAALFVYRNSHYYADFLIPRTQQALLGVYLLYLALAIPLELALPADRRRLDGKGVIALRAVWRSLRCGWDYVRHYPLQTANPPSIIPQEKTAILFLLVKFYYLPIMLNFLFGNWDTAVWNWGMYHAATLDVHQNMFQHFFPLLTYAVFVIDTGIFTLGYAFEYPYARNTVRSVEPTLFGWMIALLCYPPFNDIVNRYAVWAANDNNAFASVPATYVLHIVAFALLLLYALPSVALGFKASNLTNRGIVTRGPYALVRHPAYTGKVLGWWVMSLPILLQPDQFFLAIISMSIWTVIYFFRALTEERHLSMDPDYVEYCRRVPWRFIPYVL